MTTPTDAYSALERDAERASPGPWWTDGEYDPIEFGCSVIAARTDAGPLPGNPTRGQVAYAINMVDAEVASANARYIAAANPTVILSLIKDLRAAEAARAALEAALSLPHPAGGERVKPLEWRGDYAQSLVGMYRIEAFDNGVIWGLEGIRQNHLRPCSSTRDAKALAQADYAARIQSALEPDREPVEGEAVAEVVSAFGDPAAFGEREIRVLADLSKIPYNTKLYASPPVAHDPGREAGLEEAARTAFNALTYPVSSEIDSRGYSLRIDRNEIAFAAETLHRVLASTATSPEAVPQPSGGEGEEGR